MCSNDKYTINFNSVGTERVPFAYKLEEAFFTTLAPTEVLLGTLEVVGHIRRTGNGYKVEWDIKGSADVVCDRCLDPLTCSVDTQAAYNIVFDDEADEKEDTIVLQEGEQTIDLAWYFYESILLSLPTIRKHEENKCNSEMTATLDEYLANEHSSAADDEWLS